MTDNLDCYMLYEEVTPFCGHVIIPHPVPDCLSLSVIPYLRYSFKNSVLANRDECKFFTRHDGQNRRCCSMHELRADGNTVVVSISIDRRRNATRALGVSNCGILMESNGPCVDAMARDAHRTS